MGPRTYVPRTADLLVNARLASAGAVVIEGPKACGKTATARQHAASEVLLDVDTQARTAAEIDPRLVLAGAAPRLIDEWQIVPELWNHIRRRVDDASDTGQFLLTGSATPVDDATRHTGAGRFARVRMRPMSLFETGVSTGEISLNAVISGEVVTATDTGVDLKNLIELAVRGGWPGLQELTTPDAARAVRDYLIQIAQTDVSAVDGVSRDPIRVQSVLRSLARHTATQASMTTVARDIEAGMTDATLSSYHAALTRLMVVEDVPAFNVHLRSSHQLRKSPTRHFCCPSVAAAALRATPETLQNDLETFGLMFESLVVRDLRVYAEPIDGQVFHYRDHKGLEVDAIVDAGERWAAFEVKLGTRQIDQAAANLLRFAQRVDTSRRSAPAALCVVTGTGYGYVRPDGVRVIPIACLGP